ncbi:MAG TPA: class I SAM-dependent methyltransferase [Burkholderiales bacterium]|nr:class I SAM-dependent methyltransferase [Burkholderiales bacterium]
MNADDTSGHDGLSNLSRNSKDVAQYYDDWAADYDETLADWRYEAPKKVAQMLRAELSAESLILDAGCGTGLVGRALHEAGFEAINGIDVSSRSLQTAEGSGAYRELHEIDMQKLPLPISDDIYDGLVCVGVLTYLTDSIGTVREFSRVVKPGGVVVLTQRSDLFMERRFQDVLKQLSDERIIARVSISDARPYLPENEEFGDEILVHYISFTVV